MRSQIAILTDSTSKSNSHIVIAIEEPTANGSLDIDNLPEYLSEEELDEFLLQNGVFDKLLSQLERTPRSTDWEAELNEL